MKHLYPFILLLTWSPLMLFAQKMPDYGIHQVRINDTDKTIRAEIMSVTNMPRVRPELTYYWYQAGSIHLLQGGFSGQLLNGSYEEYYKNKNVKTQGVFEKGLKNGEWKDWNEAGKLTQSVTWKLGVLFGKFSQYDSNGRITKSGNYARNLPDGPVLFNPGTDSAKTVRYKKGQVVPPKSGTFLKRVNIFKKEKGSAGKTCALN